MTLSLIYLLESSAILGVFYLLYITVMRKETFFELNRFFLLGIVVFSLVFPLLSFDISQGKITAIDTPVAEFSQLRKSYYEAASDWEFENLTGPGKEGGATFPDRREDYGGVNRTSILLRIVLGIYLTGVIFCLSRMVLSVRWLVRVIRKNPVKVIDGIRIVLVPNRIAPFSFLNYAFISQAVIDTPEMNQIIAHEKTHIRQKHSVDLIIVQFLAAFQWFNPLIWQLIKSLKTTHEYIADKKIINSGYSLVEYQTLLLSQLISNNSYGLVHNFNLSFIKKRITMMKNNKSGWSGKLKVAFSLAIAALLSLIIVQCNSKVEEEELQVLAAVQPDSEGALSLPSIPGISRSGNYSTDNTLLLRIANDQLSALGKDICVDDLLSVIEKIGLDFQGAVILEVDEDQAMSKVREVQTELRRLDRRKILYAFTNALGEKTYEPMLLPPLPGAERDGAPLLPTFDLSDAEKEGNIAKKDGMEFLLVNLGDGSGPDLQQETYDFVMSQIARNSSDYVVSAKYDDVVKYGTYLGNLVMMKAAFTQIYEERAQEQFGKSYKDLDKSEYRKVREGVPTAISIAEE